MSGFTVPTSGKDPVAVALGEDRDAGCVGRRGTPPSPDGHGVTPVVGVVVPTRGDRPQQLRAALRAALAQDCRGGVDAVVVVDGGDVAAVTAQVAVQVAEVAARWPGRVRVLANRLTPGLPGARNTGIAALRTPMVAFCDDDDVWLPGKLSAQLDALAADPEAEFAACAIEVEYGARRAVRLAGTGRVTVRHLTRSRMMMVHSSTFVFRRGSIWPDESAPGGQNEDWDLALRAAARHPIVYVDRPLVRVRWGGSAYVSRWADRIAGLEWMLARHRGLAADRRGAARVYGQLAFCNAALGRRREAGRWALRAFAARWGEPRAPIALAVAVGLVPARSVLSALHTWGHGI
ncbi:glycosyltransferase family 2 protein [Sphaerisporangium sp. NPDC051011]|uniref:glycosyltransferase family 2 protein n=1 Tax=Sphaerisporangium sp. NPDC051011 TaxID=3155792 RepID=UPI0033E7D588